MRSLAGAVTAAFDYDDNGNLKSASSGKYRSLSYTSFNLPDSNTGAQGPGATPKYTWSYDEEHARFKEVHTDASGTRTTWYLHPDNAGGLAFESETAPDGKLSQRHYLSAGGQSVGVLISTAPLPSMGPSQTAPAVLGSVSLAKMEYWHRDHLGSLAATTDHQGAVTARYAYDPFGKRRFSDGRYDAAGNLVVDWSASLNSGTDRGFTGHEHLDDIGLVHMNGRIYDPLIGRFMSADPHVTKPDVLQNYDRYSYVLNNPLNATDPTGFDQKCTGTLTDVCQIIDGGSSPEAGGLGAGAPKKNEGGVDQTTTMSNQQSLAAPPSEGTKPEVSQKKAEEGDAAKGRSTIWDRISGFFGQLTRSFGIFDGLVPNRESFESGTRQLTGPCLQNCDLHEARVQMTADAMQGAAHGLAEAANKYYPELAKTVALSVAAPEATVAKTEISYLEKATRNSANQLSVRLTQSQAIETLAANGYVKTLSKDGTVTVMTNGDKVYRFYPAATGAGFGGQRVGMPSASVSIGKTIIAKIGFLKE